MLFPTPLSEIFKKETYTLKTYLNAYKNMPKNVTAMIWGYDVINTTCFEGVCAPVAERGIDFYICPGDGTWNYLKKIFEKRNLLQKNPSIGIENGIKEGIL